MPTLLVLNPNTSAHVSERLKAAAQTLLPALAPGWQVQAATARFGARYISDEAGAAIAGHAALDAHAHHTAAHGEPDVTLLACFGDPGLWALRALSRAPVLGLAEASMQAAATAGPFVVVTGGAAWAPMIERLAASLPWPGARSNPLLGVHTIERSGGDLLQRPDEALPLLRGAVQAAVQRFPGARSVLLGGAGLAGWDQALASAVDVPVQDNWRLALEAAVRLPLDRLRTTREPQPPGGWTGLAPELEQQLLAHSP